VKPRGRTNESNYRATWIGGKSRFALGRGPDDVTSHCLSVDFSPAAGGRFGRGAMVAWVSNARRYQRRLAVLLLESLVLEFTASITEGPRGAVTLALSRRATWNFGPGLGFPAVVDDLASW